MPNSSTGAAMTGATNDYKAQLRRSVDDATYKEIKGAALRILDTLPKNVPLGSLTAALMLAATAYAEGASQASRLITTK